MVPTKGFLLLALLLKGMLCYTFHMFDRRQKQGGGEVSSVLESTCEGSIGGLWDVMKGRLHLELVR